jgi:futalosine hydrolase
VEEIAMPNGISTQTHRQAVRRAIKGRNCRLHGVKHTMRINPLICAATWNELSAWFEEEESSPLSEETPYLLMDETATLLTGVGIPATFLRLLPFVQQHQPAHILNIGIAGAYPDSGFAIGDIVLGTSEVYGDLGFELPNDPDFQTLASAPFAGALNPDVLPLQTVPNLLSTNTAYRIHTARGCTVNACTGTERTGRMRAQLFQAGFESMEGAAVAQIGQRFGIPVSEIRAISNIASRRDMHPENIRLALTHLRDFLRAWRRTAESS